jgi:hypothetical protein
MSRPLPFCAELKYGAGQTPEASADKAAVRTPVQKV